MRNACIVLCLSLMAASAHADPVDTLRARRHTQADQPVVLRTHSHWDGNCRSSTDPRITWVTEPAHGNVDQTVEMVTAHANAVGNTNCEGMEMRGLKLTYRPEAGFRGVESLIYDVRYDNRTPVIRYEFKVTVE
jgi:hypothetical protein